MSKFSHGAIQIHLGCVQGASPGQVCNTVTMHDDYYNGERLIVRQRTFQQLQIRFRAKYNRLNVCSCQIFKAAIICLVHISDRAAAF